MALFISKVNRIPVFQVGDSTLTIENKSASGSKVAKKDKKKTGIVEKAKNTVKDFVGLGGTTKSVGLGRTKRKYKIKLFAFDREQNDDLLKTFTKKRYITITDKFKGRLRVYVDSVNIIDSDKHVNRTVFDVSCTVQSRPSTKSVNFNVEMSSAISKMEDEILPMVTELGFEVDTVATEEDYLTDVPGVPNDEIFVDEALQGLKEGIEYILDAKKSVLDAYLAVKAKRDQFKRLLDTIKTIKDFPDDLTSFLIGITDNEQTNTIDQTKDSETGQISTIQALQKSEIAPIPQPMIDGQPASDFDEDDLSQFRLEILNKEYMASELANKVKVIRDMKLILAGGFNSQDDFEKTVDATVERMYYIGYDQDEVSDVVYTIRAFANEQEYREIEIIEFTEKTTLIGLVYEKYGSLDDYQALEAINGFKENDYISGSIKVFEGI